MGNVNIQGNIPLQGPGLRPRLKGDFKQGEYVNLSNAQLDNEGRLVNRNNIYNTGDGHANENFEITNPLGFVGYIGSNAIVASNTQQWMVNRSENLQMWAPTSLPVPAAAGSYHRIMFVVEYVGKAYWITLQYDATGTFKIFVYSVTLPVFTSLSGVTFASLTSTEILSFSSLLGAPVVNNAYIFKDRLWIATDNALYFSKATDPTVFTVPDGGFIKVDRIKYHFGHSDSVYLICDENIYVYTYSVDPNNDAYLRPIANLGGMWGCVHDNTPFIISRLGIYSVNNGNIEKVHDSIFDSGQINYEYKIESFDKYLVVTRRDSFNYDSESIFNAKWYNKRGFKFSIHDYDEINASVFFINTNNWSTHALLYTDANDVVDEANRGYIVDCIFVPNVNFFNARYMYFLTNRFVSDVAGIKTYKGSTYQMTETQEELFVFDEARKSTTVVARYKPRIKAELEGYCPDGNELMMKKFRNLVGMAKLPYTDFQVSVALGDASYKTPVSVTSSNFGDNRYHHPFRIPINQRGRSISVKMETTNFIEENTSYIWDQFQLSELKVLWTHTQRLPVHPSVNSVNAGKDY